ncbi:MAG: hypothetical protein AAF724_20135 [Pseudomonadota bacterium]
MNRSILAALAVLTAGSVLGSSVPGMALTPYSERTIQCADGTIFKLTGDEITSDMACANHGGVSRAGVITSSQLKTNHAVPPEPNTPKPARKRATR